MLYQVAGILIYQNNKKRPSIKFLPNVCYAYLQTFIDKNHFF